MEQILTGRSQKRSGQAVVAVAADDDEFCVASVFEDQLPDRPVR